MSPSPINIKTKMPCFWDRNRHQPLDETKCLVGIEQLWRVLPPKAKAFLLGHEDPKDLTLGRLIDFWRENYVDVMPPGVLRAVSYKLALQYMIMRKHREQALMCLNAAFWAECEYAVGHPYFYISIFPSQTSNIDDFCICRKTARILFLKWILMTQIVSFYADKPNLEIMSLIVKNVWVRNHRIPSLLLWSSYSCLQLMHSSYFAIKMDTLSKRIVWEI